MFSKLINSKKGFTLIEVLITVAILSILASAAIPLTKMTVKRTKEIELKRNLRMIRDAIDEYKKVTDTLKLTKSADETGYPPELISLVDGVQDTKSSSSTKVIRFLRRIPRDPMNRNEYLDAEETWGLRSYESDYDNPAEGDDVYDVYSLSSGTALDGSLYKDW